MDRSIVQESAFRVHAVEVFEADSSKEALAALLMDEAEKAVVLPAFVRGVGEPAIVALFDTGVFDPAINRLIIAGHRHVMSQRDGPLIADLSDVWLIIARSIDQFAPGLSNQVSEDAFRAIVIVESDVLPSIGRAAGWAFAVSVFSAAGALFLAVALVAPARRRLVAVISVGAALAIAGLGVVAWSAVGSSLAVSRIDDSVGRTLMENGYSVFSAPLRINGFLLTVVGIGLVVVGLVGFLAGSRRARNGRRIGATTV